MREYVFVCAMRPIQEGKETFDTNFEGSVGFGFDKKPGVEGGVLRHQPEAPHSLLSGKAAAPVQQAVYMGFPAVSQ